ncbi:MAG: chemotaxis protein CheA [Myxococcota bacterium]|nr:chemotaxis protein CheA [Myxococcota bacterium]
MAARRRRTRKPARKAADQEFVSESEEILERMRQDLADIADGHAEGSATDPELVNRLFRSAHSLKGLAGLFGFELVQTLTHHLEDLLDALRLGRVPVAAPALQVIERTVALFATLLQKVGDAEALAATGDEISELVDHIEALRRGPDPSDPTLDGLELEPALLRALTEYEEHRLRENLQQNKKIYLVESAFEIVAFEEGLSEITGALREVGEVLSTLPSPGETPDSEIRFTLLAASDLDLGEIEAHLAAVAATVSAVERGSQPATVASPAEAAALEPGSKPTTGSEAPAPAPDPAPSEEPIPHGPELESLKSISDTVRVDIRKLDELMNLVGELVIQRGAIGDLSGELLGSAHTARAGNDLAKIHKSLDRKLRELQQAVLDVRMVPLRQVFEKVSRVVRRLRHELGKEVRLEMRGADTELDKLIVEELVDPLMHIVRNAMDHAIESAADRALAGKADQGTIRIDAFQRGNHVVIAVGDDGRGIDTSVLRARGEELGVVEPEEVIADKELLDLVFAPGISTREEVSETSGRGVGMDVVRTNLTRLGGVVDIDSELGRGTTVSMTLPITLAIIQSLIVSVDGQRFAIPLNAVQETLLVEPEAIQYSEGRAMLNLRGDALGLRWLREEFGLTPPPEGAKPFVVVVRMGDARIGLLVDRLEGQQDTVIKPIQGPVPEVRGIAGATELGGQDAVLVLDVSALLSDAHPRREAA